MSIDLDLNDAGEQYSEGLIPDGTFCPLRMKWRPGNENIEGCSENDIGLFKQSLSSDVSYIDAEFTVTHGAHAGRKFFQNFTVAGGQLGEDGISKGWKISKATLRAIVDSALALDPKDMSDATKAKRALRGFRDLDGLEFFAKLGVERGGPAPDGGTYKDKNRIAHIVVPGEAQYAPLKAGKEVAPAPASRSTVAAPAAAAPVQAKPVWQQDPVLPGDPGHAPPKAAAAAAPQGPAWLRDGRK